MHATARSGLPERALPATRVPAGGLANPQQRRGVSTTKERKSRTICLAERQHMVVNIYDAGMVSPSPLRPRRLFDLGREMLEHSPVLTIQGARQVGKSTLASMLVAGRDHRSVTLDDVAVLDAARTDPWSLVRAGGAGTLVIDEVQRAPELTLAVKAAVDQDRRPGRFILTGSADLGQVSGAKDSLAGRSLNLHLGPFTQGELAGAAADEDLVSAVVAHADDAAWFRSVRTDETRRDLVERICRGGYPPVAEMPERIREAWFSSYSDALLREDAAHGLRADGVSRLAGLLALLAANQAGELVKARIASDSGVPASTVSNLLDLLTGLFVVDTLPPWTPNLTTREVGRRKAYIVDSGLASWLSRLRPAQLADPLQGKALGPLLEGFVVSEVVRQAGWSRTRCRLFHYRARSTEVDLVCELDDGSVVAFEVKASATASGRMFTGLRELRDLLGDRFRAGVVLNTADHGHVHAERLYALPVQALWTTPRG